MLRRLLVSAALMIGLLACVPAVAAASDPPDPGTTTRGTVTSNGTVYPYILYTPTSYTPGTPAPLVVILHGCQTTADQQMRASLYNPVAEREGFVVLYVEADAVGRAQPGPAANCWKFADPQSYFRGSADAAGIADATRAVIAKRDIDPERVYAAGISGGGLMTSAVAAAYPDLYAAVAIHSSAGYGDGVCFASGTGIPVQASALLAYNAMGSNARVVPLMVISGDQDLAFPPSCNDKALEQGLRTDNMVLSRSQDGPISLSPASSHDGQVTGGYAYTVKSFLDPSGCLIAERWIVHGMGHFWSGGTTDPAYANFTDPKGPSAAKATWAFLSRYRKPDTEMPCAEAPGEGVHDPSARRKKPGR